MKKPAKKLNETPKITSKQSAVDISAERQAAISASFKRASAKTAELQSLRKVHANDLFEQMTL